MNAAEHNPGERQDAVRVRGSARLHMGFLDLNGGLGRRFGSIGMALDAPATELLIAHAPRDVIDGPEAERVGRHLATLTLALGLRGGHRITVRQAIPAHSGLGSGTQLALALATALRRLHGLPPDRAGDAARLGRGARSGIGVALFAAGGFVLDGGRGAADRPPPLLARLPVPADWRVLLVLDRAQQGLSGAGEAAAFRALPPMPEATAARLCRLALVRLLPALAEADLVDFGTALAQIQVIVGDYFAPAQGSRFASPRVAAALAALTAAGAHGAGQSSWGPTGFAFAPDEATARSWREAVRPHGEGLDIRICRALNHGAAVSRVAAASVRPRRAAA
jgi:beta-RFAP synthase